MILKKFFDPKKTSKLIGYTEKFEFFVKFISKDNFPNVIKLQVIRVLENLPLLIILCTFILTKKTITNKKSLFNLRSPFNDQYHK